MQTLDVLTVGNALIDAFLHIHEENQHCRVLKDTQEVCLKIGEKIPLNSCKFLPGGNACNVAVGLSRLGLQTAILAEIGTDEFSQKIRANLAQEQVDTSRLTASDGESSFAVSIMFQQDRTLFVQHVERKHAFSYEGITPTWVYLTSIGKEWRHVYREVPAWCKAQNIRLAFNPGTRQIEAGKETFQEVLAASDIFFCNKQEAQKISGSTADDIETLAKSLALLGPKIVIITDGKNGSFARDTEGTVFQQAIYPSEIVESTGAGDSFATGFMAAVVHGKSIKEALQWGTQNAASVVGKIGAQPGLLTKEQMEQLLTARHDQI